MKLDRYIRRFPQHFANENETPPWNFVANFESRVRLLLTSLDREKFEIRGEIAIHKTATVEEGAIIKGAAIIGEKCFIGSHAYLRGGVLLDAHVVVGPGCEVKSSVIFSNTALAHFNFVGDSIIGSEVNMEAGSVIANHFNEREEKEIAVTVDGANIRTGVTKFGALVGDGVKIGANAVLSPGTILTPNTIVRRLELVQQV